MLRLREFCPAIEILFRLLIGSQCFLFLLLRVWGSLSNVRVILACDKEGECPIVIVKRLPKDPIVIDRIFMRERICGRNRCPLDAP